MFSSIARVLKYTTQHIARNPWQSLLFSLVLATTLLFAQFFVVVTLASDQVLKYLENQPQVLVFFKDLARSEQLLQIKAELERDELIKSVNYISKEQAVEIYRDLHRDEPELLEFVTSDILPASLEISGNDVGHLSKIAYQFQENQLVEQVIFQRDLVQEVLALTNAVRAAGLIVVGILVLITMMIISIVVAQNINSFGHEIEIMQLVGAGSGYVAMPFILDSVIFTLIAVVLASGGLYWLMPFLEEFVNAFIAPVGEFLLPEEFVLFGLVERASQLLTASQFLVVYLGVAMFVVAGVFTSLITLWVVLRKLR